MVRKLGIFFLICYVFSATELSQLLKLPILIEHYIEHKQIQESLSVWQFLYIHYADSDLIDADSEHDLELPFKPCAHQMHADKPFQVNTAQSFILQDFGIICASPKLGYYQFKSSFTYLESIWQPPKSC